MKGGWHGFDRAPQGRPSTFLIGLVKRMDLDTTATTCDIMNRVTYLVDPDTPVQVIADMMVGGLIPRVLVTCGDRVIGVPATLDLLNVLRDE